jgi:hypothetical protein
MGEAAVKRAQYADLFDLPPNQVGEIDDEMCRAEPFDAIEIELGALWRL